MIMTYDDALNFILKKQSLGIMPGLERIKKLLDYMGNPQDNIKIIHIAGTNGKGTVAKTISDALVNNGLDVGLFTSPWVTDYREQIQLNNQPVSKKIFSKYIDLYKDNDCSEFEFLTAVMYKYFYDSRVDYAVIECGMGGRNDATNVEKNNVCSVLTSVSIDHTAFLGSSVEEILREKEGIIRKSPCFRYNDTGNFTSDNLTLVNKVLKYLGFNEVSGLSKLPARQEYLNGVLLDGGHNLSAARALEPLLDNEIAVIAMMSDKNIDGYLSVIASHCKKIIVTEPDNPRSLKAEELELIAKKYCSDVTAIKNPHNAVSFARKNGLTLICGSFYLIREIRKDFL